MSNMTIAEPHNANGVPTYITFVLFVRITFGRSCQVAEYLVSKTAENPPLKNKPLDKNCAAINESGEHKKLRMVDHVPDTDNT